MSNNFSDSIAELGSEIEHTNDPAEIAEMAFVLKQLAHYTSAKHTAVVARLAGRIHEATIAEVQADTHYDLLPEEARW